MVVNSCSQTPRAARDVFFRVPQVYENCGDHLPLLSKFTGAPFFLKKSVQFLARSVRPTSFCIQWKRGRPWQFSSFVNFISGCDVSQKLSAYVLSQSTFSGVKKIKVEEKFTSRTFRLCAHRRFGVGNWPIYFFSLQLPRTTTAVLDLACISVGIGEVPDFHGSNRVGFVHSSFCSVFVVEAVLVTIYSIWSRQVFATARRLADGAS